MGHTKLLDMKRNFLNSQTAARLFGSLFLILSLSAPLVPAMCWAEEEISLPQTVWMPLYGANNSGLQPADRKKLASVLMALGIEHKTDPWGNIYVDQNNRSLIKEIVSKAYNQNPKNINAR